MTKCENCKELIRHLEAAKNALRSYQHGNSVTELAESIADKCEVYLEKMRAEEEDPE